MACVESAIPVPNSRKKTDELFLFWLSEPSTQELLRKELVKISGVPLSELEDIAHSDGQNLSSEIGSLLSSPAATVTAVLRPGSPHMRTPSPPLLSHRSPKSPRGSGRNRSPKKVTKSPTSGKNKIKNGLQYGLEEIDSGEEISGQLYSSTLNTEVKNFEIEDMTVKHERRSRSHSPKPDSLPAGPGVNHIPKSGTNSSYIPRFYFPHGKPQPEENLHEIFTELGKLFQTFERGEASSKQFPEITKVSY